MNAGEQPNRYQIALEVLEELLPQRELFGPLFERKIATLASRMDFVCEDLYTCLSKLGEDAPNMQRSSTLLNFERMLQDDVTEMGRALVTITAEIGKAASHEKDLRLSTRSPEQKQDLEKAEKTLWALETLEMQTKNDRSSCALICLLLQIETVEVLSEDVSAMSSKLQRLLDLFRYIRTLIECRAELQPKGLLGSGAKSLPLPAAEWGVEHLVHGIGEAAGTIIPFLGALLHGYKDWRESLAKPEEAIALVKLLICIQQILALWENLDFRQTLPVQRKPETSFTAKRIEYLRTAVTPLHERWLLNREFLLSQSAG